MRYLGIDYGNARTGLAICDPMEIVVSPLTVLSTKDQLVGRILKVIEDEGVEEIVVGLPYNMDGSEGGQAKKVREFAKKLSEKAGKEIHFQDERLSSFAAHEMLSPAEMTWKKKKKMLDAVAAANILRSFLDAKRVDEKD